MDQLVASEESPLHDGTFALIPWQIEGNDDDRWTGISHSTVESTFFVSSGGCPVVPLRTLPPPDDGRVKFFRKLARVGNLPPILLLYVSPLNATIVLDGHARLAGALAEGGAIPAYCLQRALITDAVEPGESLAAFEGVYAKMAMERRDLTALNVGLSELHQPRMLRRPSRAWPLAGGASTWNAEVRARARVLGIDVDDLTRE